MKDFEKWWESAEVYEGIEEYEYYKMCIRDSLNTLWKNKEICFSMNRIYCAFKETEWRPDYYVVQDRKMLECYWEDILGLDINDKFISDRVLYLFDEKKKKEALKRVDVNLFHLQGGEAIQRNIMFSEDFAKKCYEGWTVTYACIQLAVYMGFSEIYLLGVDCNYIAGSVAQQNYFSKDYVQEDKKGSAPLPYLMMSAYESAKNYLDSKDRSKVYNATRGGKLEVFERVNFDELFE